MKRPSLKRSQIGRHFTVSSSFRELALDRRFPGGGASGGSWWGIRFTVAECTPCPWTVALPISQTVQHDSLEFHTVQFD